MSSSIQPHPGQAPATLVGGVIDWCERGLVPDSVARLGMRRLMRSRLSTESRGGPEAILRRSNALIRELRESPIAIDTAAANAQHYEVPSDFFRLHLGSCLKYSCCLYTTGDETLDQAEIAMLELYAERAGLCDGQRILDLGCGWGSLSLWLAARYPNAHIVGLSNSRGQREYIEGEARRRKLSNLRIHTGDVNTFEFAPEDVARGFDRVLSIEMFEHMKNYSRLLAKIARWMDDQGKLFVHIFAHRELAYHFQVADESDWMTRYFFTGGIMPAQALLLHFQDHVRIEEQWWVDGRHYERTANDWLLRLDAARSAIEPVFLAAYGLGEADRWIQRWRMFYMAVAELFGYAAGTQWGVAHYRFAKRTP
jgi:cyclopropane-fatty-acyl-phospholipid synthase